MEFKPMTRFLLAFLLAFQASAIAVAVDICDAKVVADEVIMMRDVPETRVRTRVVTRWEEKDGKKIPISEDVTETYTVMVPIPVEKPIDFYRASDTNGSEVGEEQMRRLLASETLVVFMFDEIPPAKRKVFKPGTLFFQAKDNPEE